MFGVVRGVVRVRHGVKRGDAAPIGWRTDDWNESKTASMPISLRTRPYLSVRVRGRVRCSLHAYLVEDQTMHCGPKGREQHEGSIGARTHAHGHKRTDTAHGHSART